MIAYVGYIETEGIEMNNATKNTTNFIHYTAMVIDEAGVTYEAANQFASKIARAYDMGEPVGFVAPEIKLFCEAATVRKTKTPRASALRVVRI
jgi:hypothetical protein